MNMLLHIIFAVSAVAFPLRTSIRYNQGILNSRQQEINILRYQNQYFSHYISRKSTNQNCLEKSSSGIDADNPSSLATLNRNDSKSIKKKSENIDLFAVDDRKTNIKDGINTMNSEASTIDIKSSGSYLGQISNRSFVIEQQAELLRLEAEKEQLQMDSIRIENEKKLLIAIDKALLQILLPLDMNITRDFPQFIRENKGVIRKELFYRIAELINSATSVTEKQSLVDIYEGLNESLKTVDNVLYTEVRADIEKDLLSENNRAYQKGSKDAVGGPFDQVQMLQQWVQQANLTSAVVNISDPSNPLQYMPSMMVRFPSAVPLNLLPLIMSSPPIAQEDVDFLRDAVFTSDILSDPIVDSSAVIVTFRGRSNVSTRDTYEKAYRRIQTIPGLADRVRLFLLPEYRLPDSQRTQTEKYSGTKFEPVFAVLSKNATPAQRKGPLEGVLTAVALLASLATSFVYAVDLNTYNTNFVDRAMSGDNTVVANVLPIVGGLLLLQLLHDLGHYVAARLNEVEVAFPSVLIPSLQIGLFGSVTRFLSFPKTRRQLFDVSIAGPVTGFIASLACLLGGFYLTAGASPDALASFPALPTGFFQISFLLHELADQFLHISSVPLSSLNTALTPVHPLLAVGIVGMLVNAFNFMPIGRLDGGRVAMAIVGRQSATGISFFTLLSQALTLLTAAGASSPLSFFWILTVVFLQRNADLPPEDDVTPIASEADDTEKGLLWATRLLSLTFCVLLTAGVLLPVPIDLSSIAQNAVDVMKNNPTI